MNHAAVDDLIASSEALVAALDADDIAAIETILPALRRSVESMKSAGGRSWPPALRGRLERALGLADAARTRILYLSDRTQQRIDMLATAAGRFDCTPATYGRPGR